MTGAICKTDTSANGHLFKACIFPSQECYEQSSRGREGPTRDVTTSPPQIVNTYKSKGIEARMSRAIAALSGAGGPINKPDKAL